ncbi:trace amine-associated receptor 13c-like [Amia ocellicauda]|uniref:trace amine-associated receptor 13c-like n=1 Tax=Amia ocellicauda TaxID=2972642 RepID=UPI003463A097
MEQTEVQYCFQSSNSSCPKEVRPTAVYVVMYISAAAVVMLTMCGNLMVIISISHFKQLHTPTNLLVLSLAVADLLVGVIVMPFQLIILIESCWYFGHLFCTIYNLVKSVPTCVSVNNVALIAIDRYIAVCDPLLYSTKITVKRACSVILFNWVFSLLYSLALLYFSGNFTSADEFNSCLGDCMLLINEVCIIIDLLVEFIIPCSVMIVLYVKIFVVVKRHVKVISCLTDNSKISITSERKAAKTLGVLVFVFLLCLVPYYICSLVFANVSNYSVLMVFLLYLNSTVNPMIYALLYPWFQKSLKLMITFEICSPGSSLRSVHTECN